MLAAMRSAALSHHLKRPEVLARLAGTHRQEVVVGVGRDPQDPRRNCILLYLPPGFEHRPPEFVTLGGERIRVLTRERGGALVAYPR